MDCFTVRYVGGVLGYTNVGQHLYFMILYVSMCFMCRFELNCFLREQTEVWCLPSFCANVSMLKDIRSLIVNTSRMEVLDIHGRKLILYVTHFFDFFPLCFGSSRCDDPFWIFGQRFSDFYLKCPGTITRFHWSLEEQWHHRSSIVPNHGD